MNWKNDDHRLNSSDLEADVSPGHFGFSALLRRAILARQSEKNVSSSEKNGGETQIPHQRVS